MTTVGNDTPNAQIIGYLILFGTGIGVTMSGIMVAVQINVARDIVAIATAVANFAWSIGGTVGLPVVSSAFINTLSSKLRQLSQDHPDHAEDIMKTMDNSRMVWKSGLPVGIRNEVIRGYVESLQVVYYLLVPVSAFALILSLFLRDKKVRPPRGGDIGQL
ncbi:hypothetical protein EV182_001466 [Spiromyces aspiralis]|uniref:Uncharacterized protein n=1 Tax=Spiromyces aspiralis TaxID=68401 RepID=A0ACC1HWK8_9FUNG|nr:hypothetical protein EV182_001466 [Spiromyces aspiralis]